MLKLLDGSRAMVALLTLLKDFYIESDLTTADKLMSFKLPKSAISRSLLQQEFFLQSATDEYVIKEINYSDEKDDPYITDENRRRGQLSWLLRAQTLVDVDCWTRVLGEPMRPGAILRAIRAHMPATGGDA